MVRFFLSAAVALTMALPLSRAQDASPKNTDSPDSPESNPAGIMLSCADLMQRHGGTPAQLTLAFNHCGDAYFKKGDFDRAIEDYNEAIKISPQFNTAFNNRGNAYFARRDYVRAIQDFSRAIQINPGYLTGSVDPVPFDYATVYRNRGNAYAAEHDDSRAIADYDHAIRLKPDDAAAFYSRGLAYDAIADYDNAIADYSKALQIDPNNVDTLCSRGVSYIHKEDYDNAMQDFDEAIRLKPDDEGAFYNRGILSNREGHYDNAIEDYDKALNIDPKSALALYSRAIAERNKGDVAGAQADQAAALKIDPIIAGKVDARESTITTAGKASAQTQPVPACMAVQDGDQPIAQVPPYVDEPIEQLKRMVPGIKGMKAGPDEKGTEGGAAANAPDRNADILDKTGTVIADLLHRMPDLIAREEVRQPISTRTINGVGLDGSLTDLASSTLDSAMNLGSTWARGRARYEAHFFTYRIVRSRSASGGNVFDEFRTDARDRPIDYSKQKIHKPFSIGFATTWLFFFPGNLHESRFRYLGQQSIGNYRTYVFAFAQDPGYSGLGAVINSGHGACSTPLQGIAWIDHSTFQMVRVQTDLLTPLPGIQLNQLRSIVSFGPVKIRGLDRTLWLPNEVGTAWQTPLGFGEELHLYSDYRLFKSTARILPAGENPPQ